MNKKTNSIPVPEPYLTLQEYFFTKVSWEAVQDFEKQETENYEDLLSLYTVRSGLVEAEGREEGEVGVQMMITTLPSAGTHLPYKVDLELFGIFITSKQIPAENRRNIVLCNGTAILYTAAREYLLTVTGRGPLPPLLLPTRSFLPSVQISAPAKQKRAKKELP